MAYSAPTVGPAGLTVPTYQEILDFLIAQYQAIYGQSVYLGNDSADYQDIAVRALMMADVMKAFQLVFANRSPVQAIGAGLDSLVKLNGIARLPASFSTCLVTLTGTSGAVVNNGIVRDVNGNLWDLPATVTIGGGGTAVATATCEKSGAINAGAGELIFIATPTAGWTSVTNADPAVSGQPVETDAQLRSRQTLSVALPSRTMLAGTIAAIRAVSGVTRLNPIENPTNATDGNGTPPHSITMVVEGGNDGDIAQAIYNNKTPGCYTNGTTTVSITDVASGITMDIRFSRPVYSVIYVTLGVHALSGYTSAVGDAIRQAVTDYLNSLEIGEMLTISGLYGAALSVMANLSQPTFSVRSLVAKVGSTPGGGDTSDIVIAYDHVSQGVLANVVITSV